MGQRLVVTIKAFDETIANIYYHWSAYTLSGLLEIKDLLESVDFDAVTSKKDLRAAAATAVPADRTIRRCRTALP